MEDTGCMESHPWLLRALLLLLGSALLVGLFGFAVCYGGTTPPDFAVYITSFEGLDFGSGDPAAVQPSFHIVLRAKNPIPRRRQRCFTQGSAVVDLDGSVVEVPFVVTGGGLGLPDQLYDERVCNGGVPSVALRVRLDGETWPRMLRCTATLDGRPSANCRGFHMLDQA
ncbi:hypothetical protein VPH35_025128 [Triticum aestivum]